MSRIVPVLIMSKQSAFGYEAGLYERDIELFAPQVFSSVAAGLRAVAEDIGEDLALYLEIRYRDISVGTFAVSDAISRSEQIASDLVGHVAAVIDSCENVATTKGPSQRPMN